MKYEYFLSEGMVRGVLVGNRLRGCGWMGSYFHDWIDYHGVAFSIVTRTGSHICGNFGGKKILVGGDIINGKICG